MSDDRPATPRRKLSLIAPLSIAAVGGAILLFAVLSRPDTPEPAAPAPAPPPPAPIAAAAPPPALTRADLVDAAERATTAFATGTKAGGDRSPLIGRSFRLDIAFGCDGPRTGADGGQAFAEYDIDKGVLRLVARPVNLTALPLVKDLDETAEIEAVEGFWIPRPWAATETCPPKRAVEIQATPTPPAAQTLALAQVFETSGSRVSRRGGRPYEFVRKVDKADTSVLSHTYRLRLEGRLVGFKDGQPHHCWSESPDHRPICLYAVAYDRVAFLDGDTGETLSEWRD
ncbi:hypothetical protein [Phenylobacterium sp.]|uniref:hypothetical protein n=1 Tax=Phenylobacterium sp. TaxID=1871053 RepID=UPI00286D87CA|nr:hypothetical protein [Phenylobacterium sp.]